MIRAALALCLLLSLYRVELHTRTDGVIVRYVHARSPEAARNIIVDGSWMAWVRDVRVEPVSTGRGTQCGRKEYQ